ncbi:oxidoreductase [Cytobacillus sp. FJAT-54145]|uniref:Oxidoreductase n=1 Tax=Cytobacillus spartinae TaxID=3299023 RepID=A0ABW6KFP0_9BACI
MKEKSALIAGATGLIGSSLLQNLLDGTEYEKVIAIVRSPLNISHPKLIEKIVDFNELETYKEVFEVDDVFCCLGTTIKKAKTQENMFRIDVEYPLSIARLASERNAKQYFLVSSMGADPNSSIWYSKMKGTLEQELKKIPFETISIMRPSLLLGHRKEFRLGERVASVLSKPLSFLFLGPLKKYRAIEASTVALAMYKIAQSNKNGIKIYESEKIQKVAENYQ